MDVQVKKSDLFDKENLKMGDLQLYGCFQRLLRPPVTIAFWPVLSIEKQIKSLSH